MVVNKVTKTIQLFLSNGSSLTVTKGAEGIYKNIIDEVNIFIPDLEATGGDVYIPYHALYSATITSESSSDTMTDEVCDNSGGRD